MRKGFLYWSHRKNEKKIQNSKFSMLFKNVICFVVSNLPGVSGIVAFIDVCRWGYRTSKFLGFIQKSCCHNLFYACIFVVITLVGPTKVSIMKLKHTMLNRMWQHDFWMKLMFFSSIFLSENTGRLAKQAGYLGHNFWHTLYKYFLRSSIIIMLVMLCTWIFGTLQSVTVWGKKAVVTCKCF